MMTESEVRALIARLRGQPAVGERVTSYWLLREAADALEQLLPSHYAFADDRSGGIDRLEDMREDWGAVHLIPATAWDDCWAARRGEEVRTFPTWEQANDWIEEEGE